MSHNESPDMFYYNIIINNSGTESIPANYSEQRDIPLMTRPSDYYMSVIRFSVPGFSIPISIIPSTNFPNLPVATPFNLYLEYNGTLVTQNVIFYSRNTSTVRKNIPNSNYYYIYDYQHFVDLVNNAFSLAVAALKTAVGSALNNLTTPFMIYNAQTQLLSLVTTQYFSGSAYTEFYETPSANYLTTTPTLPANKVNIFFNSELFNYFQALPVINFPNQPNKFWMLIENTYNNYYNDPQGLIPPTGPTGPTLGPLGLQQTQQFNSLNTWNSFNSLAFISKSLPILKEFTPNVGYQNSNNTTQASSNTLPIITDYVPLLQFAGDQKADFVYNASSLYRLIQLQGINALYSIDLEVVWIDQYNNQYPIIVEPGQSINIKFMFVKKSLYGMNNKLITSF
jgi:hypothetical protein